MKQILLLALAGASLAASAQDPAGKAAVQAPIKEGVVVYEQTRKMNIGNIRIGGNVSAEMQAEIDAQLAKPQVHQFELLFTPEHSLYQYLPMANAEAEGGFMGPGGGIMLARPSANTIAYVNLQTGQKVEQRDMMGESFVVTDTVARVQWRLTDETKPILQFVARKAIGTTVMQRMLTTMENGELKRQPINDTVRVVAWYTPVVPVPTGPQYNGQLPGLLLELEINNAQTVIKAIEFSPKVAANKIKPPKDGKAVTAAEFSKERDRLLLEMQKNGPLRITRSQ